MYRQRMHPARKLAREHGVDHAVALEPALSAEGVRHDIEAEMGFSARPVAGMAFVAVRLVLDAQALRGESLAQLFGDDIRLRHGRMPLAAFSGTVVTGFPKENAIKQECAARRTAVKLRALICGLSSLEGDTAATA